MKKKHVLFLSLFLSLIFTSFSSLHAQIKWTTPNKLSSKKKTVFVLYTQWDGWSKRMDQYYLDKSVGKYVNKNFNFTRLNVDTQKTITFKGKTYQFDPKDGTRGRHELAKELAGADRTIPMLVILDENQELIQVVPGFYDKNDFNAIMKYFGEETYKEQSWEEFEKTLKLKKKDDSVK